MRSNNTVGLRPPSWVTLQQDMSQGSNEMIGVSLGDQEFMELSYWEGWEEPTDTAWSDGGRIQQGLMDLRMKRKKQEKVRSGG